MLRIGYLIVVLASVLGCTSVTGPLVRDESDPFRGPFRIVVREDGIVRTDSGISIVATVTNTSRSRDFYARVGDGTNAAPEQAQIYAAVGTDAEIERRVSFTTWTNATSTIPFEGSNVVVLRAGKSYRLSGMIRGDSPGPHRIRLSVFTREDRTTIPLHAVSAAFVVE